MVIGLKTGFKKQKIETSTQYVWFESYKKEKEKKC
jgi:hypothetical protein